MTAIRAPSYYSAWTSGTRAARLSVSCYVRKRDQQLLRRFPRSLGGRRYSLLLGREMKCPNCNLNWVLNPPAPIVGTPSSVRCIECKEMFLKTGPNEIPRSGTTLSIDPFEAFAQLKKARELAPDQPGMDNALWLTLERTIVALTEARRREIKVRWTPDGEAFTGKLRIGKQFISVDLPGKFYACCIYFSTYDDYFDTESEARAAVEAAAVDTLTEREMG